MAETYQPSANPTLEDMNYWAECSRKPGWDLLKEDFVWGSISLVERDGSSQLTLDSKSAIGSIVIPCTHPRSAQGQTEFAQLATIDPDAQFFWTALLSRIPDDVRLKERLQTLRQSEVDLPGLELTSRLAFEEALARYGGQLNTLQGDPGRLTGRVLAIFQSIDMHIDEVVEELVDEIPRLMWNAEL